VTYLPRRARAQARTFAAVHGGKASKGRNAPRGSAGARARSAREGRSTRATRRKRGEPQGRRPAATCGAPSGRRKPARWHQTTRSEHGWEVAFPSRRRKATGQPAGELREWTPWRARRRRGDLWTIPREEARTRSRKADGRAAGPGSVGKDGAKVRRGERTSFNGCKPPRRWSSKAATPRDRARPKATEDSSEGPRAATSFRASPRPRRVPRRKPGDAPRGKPPGRARGAGGWEATCRRRQEYPCRPSNPTPGPDVDQRGAIPLNGVRALVRPPPSTRERRARSSL